MISVLLIFYIILYLQITELEGKLTEAEKSKAAAEELNKKPGVKDTVEVTKLKKEIKTKTDELDKLKTQSKKVKKILT